MDAVTYPNEEVIDFCNESLIPLRVRSNAKPISDDFNIKWTPALITLDSDGMEHHRTIGFLEPKEMIARLLLGEGKCNFDKDCFDEALAVFEKILADYPDTDAAPEAAYLRGVSRYKSSGDPKPLREAYDQLKESYPDSEWTMRAYPYRLFD
ncbi:MAG: tol-pal system YbgF family protein [Desulfurivibrionaceae bacterium]